MKREVIGTVVAGGVKFDQPIDLPENCRVRVAIESLSEWRTAYRASLKSWQRFCEQHPVHSGGRRFSRDELHERD